MNVTRALRLVFSLLLILLVPVQTWAATSEPIVVLMDHTIGAAAWTTAEARLTAELRGLRMRVVEEGSVTELDTELPERTSRVKAFVGIQVLRDGDRGIIRFWFAPQRGQRSGYQHLELSLRNADVVSRAVLPVVEAIFDRTQTSMQYDGEQVAQANEAQDPCAAVGTRACGALVALRLGMGAFLVNADSGAAPAADVGLRLRAWPATRLELDAAYLFAGQRANGEELHRQWSTRAHFMWESWGRDGRGAAIGPGVGLISVDNAKESVLRPSLNARVSLFAAVSRSVNFTFSVTGARMLGEPPGLEANPWSADAVLALDWYLGM